MADLTTSLSKFLNSLIAGTVDIGLAGDALLVRDAANTIAQRNGTSAQSFHLYETFTDASNYARVLIGYNAANGTFDVLTQEAGTGSDRGLRIGTNVNAAVQLMVNGTARGVLSTSALAMTVGVTSSSATAGIGYATGAGGTVTQLTSKSTGVELNKATGEITMNGAILNAATIVSFVLTNSAIAAGDHVLVQHVSGGTVGAYGCTAVAAAGSATITVRNNTAGNLTEAPVLKFSVLKSVTA